MEAALTCFGELGLVGVSAEEIAGRCGRSEATFSRYFGSSEECLRIAFGIKTDWLAGQLLECSNDALTNVERAIVRLADFMAEQSRCARAILIEARTVAGPTRRFREDLLERLATGLDRTCRREARCDPPALAGVFIVGAVEQFAVAALAEGRPAALIGAVPELTELISRAYGLSDYRRFPA